MSLTDLGLAQVTVNSAFSLASVSFSLASAVPGVSVSSNLILFSPGSYTVQINLPSGYGGGAGIVWSSAPPAPGGAVSSSGTTSVQFGLLNSLTGGSAVYTFSLTYTTSPRRSEPWPVIASDPPPSVVFQST